MTFEEELSDCVLLLSKIKAIVDEEEPQENDALPDPASLSFTKREQEKKLDIIIAKLRKASFDADILNNLLRALGEIHDELKAGRLDKAQEIYNRLEDVEKKGLQKFLELDEVPVNPEYFLEVMSKSVVREFRDAQIDYILELYNKYNGASAGFGLYRKDNPDGSTSYVYKVAEFDNDIRATLGTISSDEKNSRAKVTRDLIRRFMDEVYEKLTKSEKDTINAWLRIDMENGRLIQPAETNESTIKQLIGDVATTFKGVQKVHSNEQKSLEQALPEVGAYLDRLESRIDELFEGIPDTKDGEQHHMDVTSTIYITDELSDNTQKLIGNSHASKKTSASDKPNKSRVNKIIDFFIEKLHQFLDAVNRLGEYLKSLVPEVKTTSKKMRF